MDGADPPVDVTSDSVPAGSVAESVTEDPAPESVVPAGATEGDTSSSDVLVSTSSVDPDPSGSLMDSVDSGADVDDGMKVESSVEATPAVVPAEGPLNSMVGSAVPGGCVSISKSNDSVLDTNSVVGADVSDPASGPSVGTTDTCEPEGISDDGVVAAGSIESSVEDSSGNPVLSTGVASVDTNSGLNVSVCDSVPADEELTSSVLGTGESVSCPEAISV